MTRLTRGLLVLSILCLPLAACARPQPPGAPPAAQPPAPAPQPVPPAPADSGNPQEARAFLVRLLDERVARKPLDNLVAPAVLPLIAPSLSNPFLRQYRVEFEPAAQVQPPRFAFLVQGTWEYTGQFQRNQWERFTVLREAGKYTVVAYDQLPGEVTAMIQDKHTLTYASAAGGLKILDTTKDLPTTVRPLGADPGSEFGPGRELALVALSPDNRRVAFVSRDVHAFLGVVDVARPTPPVDRKLVPVDLYYGGGARELAWAYDNTHLAVTVVTPRPDTLLAIYNVAKMTRTNVQLPGEPSGLRWTEDRLLFTVNGQPWQWIQATGQAGQR